MVMEEYKTTQSLTTDNRVGRLPKSRHARTNKLAR